MGERSSIPAAGMQRATDEAAEAKMAPANGTYKLTSPFQVRSDFKALAAAHAFRHSHHIQGCPLCPAASAWWRMSWLRMHDWQHVTHARQPGTWAAEALQVWPPGLAAHFAKCVLHDTPGPCCAGKGGKWGAHPHWHVHAHQRAAHAGRELHPSSDRWRGVCHVRRCAPLSAKLMASDAALLAFCRCAHHARPPIACKRQTGAAPQQ